MFLISTTLVAIMKKENNHGQGKRRVHEETQGVMETYKLLFSIIKMPTVFTFCSLLLTAKVLQHYVKQLLQHAFESVSYGRFAALHKHPM